MANVENHRLEGGRFCVVQIRFSSDDTARDVQVTSGIEQLLPPQRAEETWTGGGMASDSGQDSGSNKHGSSPVTGSRLGAGIAIGAGLGVALGVAFDSLPVGIAIGTGIGVALGAAMEQGRGSGPAGSDTTRSSSVWIAIGLGLALLLGMAGVYVVMRLR